MPTSSSENFDERILKLIDELDAARTAYHAATTAGNGVESAKHLSRIREAATKIDLLRYGAGDEPSLCKRRSTKA